MIAIDSSVWIDLPDEDHMADAAEVALRDAAAAGTASRISTLVRMPCCSARR